MGEKVERRADIRQYSRIQGERDMAIMNAEYELAADKREALVTILNSKQEAIKYLIDGSIELARCFSKAASLIRTKSVTTGRLALVMIESDTNLMQQLAAEMPKIREACQSA